MADPVSTTETTTYAAAEAAGEGAGTTARANRDSVRLFRAAAGALDYQNDRVECMDGHTAQNRSQNTGGFQNAPDATVGEVCRLIMEHSADVQRNPSALKARPDQSLLAPYAAIAADKSGRGSPAYALVKNDAAARATLNQFVAASNNPEIQNLSGLIDVALPNGNHLKMTPGVVLDAHFTKTVLDGLAGKTVTLSQYSDAQLANAAEACNYNAKDVASVAVCKTAGNGLGALYLQRNGVRVAPR